jgi:hypothetical protein
MYTHRHNSDAQFYLILTSNLSPAKWHAQPILSDAINLGGGRSATKNTDVQAVQLSQPQSSLNNPRAPATTLNIFEKTTGLWEWLNMA